MVGAQRQPWGTSLVLLLTLKGFGCWRTLTAFRLFLNLLTQGRRGGPSIWLELANAFGVLPAALQPLGWNWPTPSACCPRRSNHWAGISERLRRFTRCAPTIGLE